MEVFDIVPLVVFVPIIGLLLNLWIGKNLSERGVALIACGAAAAAFLIAVVLGAALLADPGGKVVPVIDWVKLPAVGVEIPWALRVDTLSVTMMLAVAGVGALIHIYAAGYMHGDPGFRRFFVYMNLFLASMLVLVTGNNFLVLFVGWELVGLCSFLLIGFWLHRGNPDPETGIIAGIKNSNAAKKAFIVNRVGDFGFILAILLIWWTFGTLDFGPINGASHGDAHETAIDEEVHGGVPTGELTLVSGAAAASGGRGICQPEAIPPSEGGGVFPMVAAFMAQDCSVKVGEAEVPIGVMVTVITLLMLLGVAGKSAQIPLFVWLPDAMAGPTPVSALIHAATMVTAGVYLITRSNVLYEAARTVEVLPLGLNAPMIVTLAGALTAFMAGTIAVAQWDIKRVLAYSTISQLGFMVAAVGLGGYVAGMFHLVTHAFFKALLFLSAGSVIHGVEHGAHHAHEHGEHESRTFGYREGELDPQDMRNMGGLRARMPVTFWVYTIGALALAGIFPFAGFWSKDEILLDAFVTGAEKGYPIGWIAFILLIVAAAFTAFYMGRQVYMIFFGPPRTRAAAHAAESPPVMLWPLVALAALSVVGGVINVPGLHPLGTWLEQSVAHAHTFAFNPALAVGALVVALVAVALASLLYLARPALNADGTDALQALGPVWRFLNRKWYWDEAYDNLVVRPFNAAASFLAYTLDVNWWRNALHENVLYDGFNRVAGALAGGFDLGVIDRAVNGVGALAARLASVMRRLQTGYVRIYALSVLLGVLVVLLILLLPLIGQ